MRFTTAALLGLAACGGAADDPIGNAPDAASDLFRLDDIDVPGAAEMQPYSLLFSALDGAEPYTWSVAAGALPAGLSLIDSGLLSGVPERGSAGDYAFTLSAVDAGGFSAEGAFSLTVAPEQTPSSYPLDAVDDVTLYLNLGDSFGAGYNASAGRGYAPLLHHNHAAYPAYAQHHVTARFAGAAFVDRAESGATSADVLSQTNALPSAGGGDVVVTIYVGGNDFNDDLDTILLPAQTQAAIASWRANLGQVVDRLRAAYGEPVIAIATIHDPTDGLGTIPPQYDDDFCGTIQQVPDFLRPTGLQNFADFNAAIRAFAAERELVLVDTNVLFIGHGLNAPAGEQWIDTDCAHGTNEGHHQVRREIWGLLAGERP